MGDLFIPLCKCPRIPLCQSPPPTPRDWPPMATLRRFAAVFLDLGWKFWNVNLAYKINFDLLHTTSSFQHMIKVDFLIGFQATTITIATLAQSLWRIMKGEPQQRILFEKLWWIHPSKLCMEVYLPQIKCLCCELYNKILNVSDTDLKKNFKTTFIKNWEKTRFRPKIFGLRRFKETNKQTLI